MTNEFYINAIVENLFNMSIMMGSLPKGVFYNGEDIKWSYTGGLATNRIFPRRMNEENIDKILSEVLSRFNAWNVPFDLFLCPNYYPLEMEKHLMNHGLVYSRRWVGMALPLDGYYPKADNKSDIEIIRVEDLEKIKVWSRIGGTCFGVPEKRLKDLQDLYVRLFSKPDSNIIYYMGLKNGIPVATTYLFKDGNVAGLYMVGTLPEARGAGIAQAMVLHALKEAISMGCSHSILHASEMGKVVYPKIGFKEYCIIDIYKVAE